MPLAGSFVDFQRDPGAFAASGYMLQRGMGLAPFSGRGLAISGGDVHAFRGRGGIALMHGMGHVLRPSAGVVTQFAHIQPRSGGRLRGRAARVFRHRRRGGVHGGGLYDVLRSAFGRAGRVAMRAGRHVLPIVTAAGSRALLDVVRGRDVGEALADAAQQAARQAVVQGAQSLARGPDQRAALGQIARAVTAPGVPSAIARRLRGGDAFQGRGAFSGRGARVMKRRRVRRRRK